MSDDAAPEADLRDAELSAPVARVTLLEDRAQVTRAGRLRLDPGPHRLRVRDVSPLVADRTLTARVPDGVRADEVRVERSWRIGASEQPPDAAAHSEEIRGVRSELERAERLEAALRRRCDLTAEALRLRLEALNRELPWAEAGPREGADPLDELVRTVRALDERRLDASDELDDLRERLDELERRAAQRPAAERVLAAELVVDVTVEAAGAHDVELAYTVPCAQWRPIHRATLVEASGGNGAAAEVQLECEGAVWQATGEDWTEVELSFSTSRPTQRSEPPLLADDLLTSRPRAEKTTTVETREEVIQTTGEGAATTPGEGLPGVDDGGEARLLHATARVTVPADGRLHRVPIFTVEAPAEVDRVCRPELERLVHLRSRQANTAPHPLLAGPVDLLRRSGYVGRGEVGFVGPGERFALGWGSEDGLRVERRVDEGRKQASITGKQTVTRTVTCSLSNLDDRPARFTLEERVPVSELTKVTVEVDAEETAPPATPDEQGIARWEVDLPAHGTREVKLVYRIVAGSDVRGL